MLAVIVAAAGIVGITNISKTSENSGIMFNQDTVSIDKLSEVAQLYQRTRVIVRDIILIEDQERMQSEVDNLAGKDKAINAALDETAPLMDEGEAAMLDIIRQSISTYLPLRQKVVDTALTGDSAGAYALLEDPGTDDAAMAVQDAISALEEQVLTNAEKEYAQNEALAQSSLWVTVGLVGAAVVLAVLLGLLISGIISKPVRRLAEVAKSMAAGKTDVDDERG